MDDRTLLAEDQYSQLVTSAAQLLTNLTVEVSEFNTSYPSHNTTYTILHFLETLGETCSEVIKSADLTDLIVTILNNKVFKWMGAADFLVQPLLDVAILYQLKDAEQQILDYCRLQEEYV